MISVEKSTKLALNVQGWEGGQSPSKLVELMGLHRVIMVTRLHVCMYACMYVCVYVCMYVPNIHIQP